MMYFKLLIFLLVAILNVTQGSLDSISGDSISQPRRPLFDPSSGAYITIIPPVGPGFSPIPPVGPGFSPIPPYPQPSVYPLPPSYPQFPPYLPRPPIAPIPQNPFPILPSYPTYPAHQWEYNLVADGADNIPVNPY